MISQLGLPKDAAYFGFWLAALLLAAVFAALVCWLLWQILVELRRDNTPTTATFFLPDSELASFPSEREQARRYLTLRNLRRLTRGRDE